MYIHGGNLTQAAKIFRHKWGKKHELRMVYWTGDGLRVQGYLLSFATEPSFSLLEMWMVKIAHPSNVTELQ